MMDMLNSMFRCGWVSKYFESCSSEYWIDFKHSIYIFGSWSYQILILYTRYVKHLCYSVQVLATKKNSGAIEKYNISLLSRFVPYLWTYYLCIFCNAQVPFQLQQLEDPQQRIDERLIYRIIGTAET